MTAEEKPEPDRKPLRAIIVIPLDGGEPVIYPLGDTDIDRAAILDYLRIFLEKEPRK
jgi:hypothetical protein